MADFTLKTTGTATEFLNGTGAYSTPAGGTGLTIQTTDLNLAVPSSYTLANAITAAMQVMPNPGVKRKVNISGQNSISDLGAWDNYFSPIEFIGDTPVTLAFSGVNSVTGSKGNWDVEYAVTSATNVAVGDVITMKSFTNSHPSQGLGTNAPGSFGFGISYGTDCNITCPSSTTVTFSAAVSGTEVVTGDIIGYLGQYRKVTATPTSTTATVSSAFTQSANAHIYWQLLKPESGTLGCSGTTITGTSTSFTTRCSPGDFLVVADTGEIVPLVTVSSNTSMTIQRSMTISSGKTFAIAKACWQHEGAFKVTAKSGNNITVKNNSWSEYKPPSVGLGSCTMKCIKSVITATTGFKLSGAWSFKDIAIVGGSSNYGIDCTGSEYKRIANLFMNDTTAIIGFSTGVYIAAGSSLYGRGACFMSAAISGVQLTQGGTADLDSAYMCGNSLYGLLHDGAYARISRARLCNNGESGIRTDAGGWYYGDWAVANGNGGRSLQIINASGGQFVGGQCMLNGGNGTGGGLNLQNGGMGRYTGSMFVCNNGNGLQANGGQAELDYALFSGNYGTGGGTGLASGSSMLSAQRSAATFNTVTGYAPATNTFIDIKDSYATGNPTGNIITNSNAWMSAVSMCSLGGSANDYLTVGGGKTYMYGYKGSPSISPTLNKIGQAGSLNCNDTQVSFLP